MTFDYPFILSAFAVFIPLFIFDFIRRGNSQHRLPEELEKKLHISTFFFRLFLAFAITALAGPRWGTGFSPSEYRRGLDAVFAIDISRSMDIRDARTSGSMQSRLERGLSIARESIASVPGARYAAAVGRGRGYLAVPLTYDNEAALSFLSSLDGSSMTGRSTNLESLLEAALGAFQNTSAARKVIVLVSDGESHAGIFRNAVNKCARDGIAVIAVAVGSDEGRQIEADSSGQPMSAVSRRDAAVMRIAAERTGGIYIDGGREDAASALAAHFMSLAQETGSGNSRKESKQRRTLFIILAIIAYGASKFVPLVPLARPALVSILSMLVLLSSCSEGKLLLMEANYLNSRGRYDEAAAAYLKALNFDEAAPYAEYGLGLVFYALDEGDAALKRYGNSKNMLEKLSSGEHRELNYRNHYNSGIILFEKEDFHSAAAAFREALKADPRRIDAKRNLELSLLAISMESNQNNRTESRNEQREILFDYIRQKEQQHWKSREWTAEENQTGPDY
jgi:Ca-activated chloride channel family protein